MNTTKSISATAIFESINSFIRRGYEKNEAIERTKIALKITDSDMETFVIEHQL